MSSPRVRFAGDNQNAQEVTTLLADAKSLPRSSYGATLATLTTTTPAQPVSQKVKVSRSRSLPNLKIATPTYVSGFRHHHMIRLYQHGVPRLLDDSPDIYRADWPERRRRNQKAAIVGTIFFTAAIVLSQKGPDDISKLFGWIFAVLLGWGCCYCCSEGFFRNRPRNNHLLRNVDPNPVVVTIDPPPIQIQSSESTNATTISAPSSPRRK